MAPSNFTAVLFSLLCSIALIRCFEEKYINRPDRGGTLQHFSSQGQLEMLLNTKENFLLSNTEKIDLVHDNPENLTFDLSFQNVSDDISTHEEVIVSSKFGPANLNKHEERSNESFIKKNSMSRRKTDLILQALNNSTLKFDLESFNNYSFPEFANTHKISEELNSSEVHNGNLAFSSTKKQKAERYFIQSIVSFVFEKIVDLVGIIQHFSVLPLQSELVEASLSSIILDLLHTIDTNFQEYSDIFVQNLFIIWTDFLNTKTFEMRAESVKHSIDVLNGVDLHIQNLKKNWPHRVTLNHAFDYVRDKVAVLESYIGPLNNNGHNQSSVEDFLFEKFLAQVCESSMWDEKVIDKVTETLLTTLLSVGNLLDSYIENIHASLIISSINSEFIQQTAEWTCFLVTEVPKIHVDSQAATNETSLPETSIDFSELQRGMFIEWYKYFDIYFLAERLKKLPFMTKEWDLQTMFESVQKSIRVAWMALLQSDPKDIAVTLYGDLLPKANDSQAPLRLKCVDLISELQDFQRSQAAGMEELIRMLLRRATELQCYNLGAADPVLQRLQFLFSMLRARRNVLFNPFDPLNVARDHMEAVLPA